MMYKPLTNCRVRDRARLSCGYGYLLEPRGIEIDQRGPRKLLLSSSPWTAYVPKKTIKQDECITQDIGLVDLHTNLSLKDLRHSPM